MPLISKAQPGAPAIAGGEPRANGSPPPPAPKPRPKPTPKPKVVSFNKKAASKVSMLNSKLTESRCVHTQIDMATMCLGKVSGFLYSALITLACLINLEMYIHTCAVSCNYCSLCLRGDVLKNGYKQELATAQSSLDASKVELELWYAERLSDTAVVGEALDKFELLIANADGALNLYASTFKTIKSAIASWLAVGLVRYVHSCFTQTMLSLTTKAPKAKAKPKRRAAGTVTDDL